MHKPNILTYIFLSLSLLRPLSLLVAAYSVYMITIFGNFRLSLLYPTYPLRRYQVPTPLAAFVRSLFTLPSCSRVLPP
ncbi:hypothetical protein K438DRAFT_1872970 [Mycena galopus ATCC 62051]|nr:hypothetical protein K438DRAFT_1893455 [Mycena galopus ATCC 62051]KAF8144874.1 hypothetical protein K438DRAFT_1872970 [Mycena galopus ATCC 62051]